MDDKITTLVAIVGIAVAISREAREWYKATKKEKRQNPIRKRRKWRFSRGEGQLPSPQLYISRKRKSRWNILLLF